MSPSSSQRRGARRSGRPSSARRAGSCPWRGSPPSRPRRRRRTSCRRRRRRASWACSVPKGNGKRGLHTASVRRREGGGRRRSEPPCGWASALSGGGSGLRGARPPLSLRAVSGAFYIIRTASYHNKAICRSRFETAARFAGPFRFSCARLPLCNSSPWRHKAGWSCLSALGSKRRP